MTAITASSANPDCTARTICASVCASNWNQAHVLVASVQRHIDSIHRFTVHNNTLCNETSHTAETVTCDGVSMSLYMC